MLEAVTGWHSTKPARPGNHRPPDCRLGPMSAFASIHWLDHLRIWDGVTAQAVEGDRVTLAVVDLEPGASVLEHRHDNEQLGF